MEFDATFLVAAFSFILFVIIMNKIFYAPILKIMQERSKLVEDNFNSAKLISQQTADKTNFHNSELSKSRDEARSKIAQETQLLRQEQNRQMLEYKKELFTNVAEEKENLKNSAIAAKETLKENVVDIAKNISSVLLGEDINAASINKSQVNVEGQE